MAALIERAGLADRIEVDSAGTGDWHVGEPADQRSREAARTRGYDLPSIARQFQRPDFDRFDHVLAMDRSNRRALLALARRDEDREKVQLFRAFDPEAQGDADVPDPYYGGPGGFDEVLDMCERTCRNLLDHVCKTHALKPRGWR